VLHGTSRPEEKGRGSELQASLRKYEQEEGGILCMHVVVCLGYLPMFKCDGYFILPACTYVLSYRLYPQPMI
jgi:hypothetical protein